MATNAAAAPPSRPDFENSMTTFEKAFKLIKSSVTGADAVNLQSTTLKEVEEAAQAIEARQRERRSMRNMARLKPFLDGLRKYSKVIEVMCNGTDYLPWIWVGNLCRLIIENGTDLNL
jgi:hypothetical protein